jgi:hypothetical protein
MSEHERLHFSLLFRHPLRHAGAVGLLGATRDSVWAEEVYGEGWVAQHRIGIEDGVRASVDEDEGRATGLKPLAIADEAVLPRRGWDTMGLNFAGARHHGLREEDRLLDVAQSISVAGRFALAERLHLPAPTLLGIAESYVLAEAPLTGPTDWLVCRRLRIAHAVPRQTGADGLPFDYDTRELLLLHRYDTQAEPPPLEALLADPAGAELRRPMDCVRLGDRLIVAEGGHDEEASAVCILAIDGLPAPVSRTDALFRKLYG